MTVGCGYIWALNSNQHPTIPPSIAKEVKSKIESTGKAYLDTIPVHDNESSLRADESYKVTKIEDYPEIVMVAYKHNEMKDFRALLSLGHFGSVVENTEYAIIKTGFEPDERGQ